MNEKVKMMSSLLFKAIETGDEKDIETADQYHRENYPESDRVYHLSWFIAHVRGMSESDREIVKDSLRAGERETNV